ELRSRIYGGSIALPDHPDLLAELRALRAKFKAGRASVVTPRTSRGHSDLAVALALAVWGLDRHGLGTSSQPYAGGDRHDLLRYALGPHPIAVAYGEMF